ncbi:MAG: hypothetical protein NXI27_27800 [Alphaproteobacteria bacterium]|nr:hypothetical protein [Alphaproteobacteria bacterium]
MSNKIVTTALAALVLSSPLAAVEAMAKIKVVKHHFVQSNFEDYPVMEMKFSGGKWKWINKGKVFKPRVKLYFKSTTKVDFAKLYTKKGGIALWSSAAGYKTKKFEKLVKVSVGAVALSPQLGKARSVCKSSGGAKKVVKDIAVNTIFVATDNKTVTHHAKASTKPMLMKVVCQSKLPNGNTNSAGTSKFKFAVANVSLHTVPANPVCGKPVKLVANFQATGPGKVNFMLFRGDGAKQNASVMISKNGNGYMKHWAKSYKFSKTTKRKYMIVVKGHKVSTNWVPLKVQCKANGKQAS